MLLLIFWENDHVEFLKETSQVLSFTGQSKIQLYNFITIFCDLSLKHSVHMIKIVLQFLFLAGDRGRLWFFLWRTLWFVLLNLLSFGSELTLNELSLLLE